MQGHYCSRKQLHPPMKLHQPHLQQRRPQRVQFQSG